jgi:hypothetical protein
MLASCRAMGRAFRDATFRAAAWLVVLAPSIYRLGLGVAPHNWLWLHFRNL